IVSKPELVDLVLDAPLSLTARSLYTYDDPSTHRRALSDEMAATSERTISAHLGRMAEIPMAAFRLPWLRLIVVVPSPCGSIVHGLSGGLANILRLIDGRRTGREIYSQLPGAGSSYSLDRFRRHLGVLRRVGAIGFSERHAQVASAA